MSTAVPSQSPKRMFQEELRLWVYSPQDRTLYWTYFKRPFFLLAFPNIVIVCIPRTFMPFNLYFH
jgi:hypothetical protein